MILLSPVCVFLAAIIFGEINGFFNFFVEILTICLFI